MKHFIRRATAALVHCTAALACLAGAKTALAQADQVNVSYLQGLLPKADGAVATLGPDLMGDRVNLFNGALEFEHTDVTVPGNSALPVALTRRHVAGRTVFVRGAFGDWDLETPRISGVFANTTGWVNAAGGVDRCSTYSAPPVQYRAGSGGGGPAARAIGGASAPAAALPGRAVAAAVSVTFYPTDYWQGNFLHVPGAGGQEVFRRPAADTFVPTDGNSYYLLTKGKWQLRCLSALQNAAGEGFIALSPEGVTYRFDWMASRFQPATKREGASLGRREYMLMATQVTDRFGNWVSYTYSAAAPEQLSSIQSSDGRQINLVYDGSGRVSTVSDGSRTWTYGYSAQGDLSTVTRPDNSRWTFNLRPLVHTNVFELGELASCESAGVFPESNYVGTVTHPSGAVGTFTLRFTQHNRSNVTKWCLYVGTKSVGAKWPKSSYSQSLVGKAITGPGLPAGGWSWSYLYGGGAASWAPCNPCADTKVVDVTDPSGVKTRHTFGVRFQSNEGQLLAKDEAIPAGGGLALRTTAYRYRQTGPWPEPAGASINENSDYLSSRHRPEDQRITSQQSSTFTWEAAAAGAGFDPKARVIEARKFSSSGHSRTDRFGYHDNTTRWVIGQLATLTEATTGLVEVERNDYHSTTALRSAKYAFGRLLGSYTYHADGLLWQRLDPLNRATTFTSYHRGIARNVTGRYGASESAVVNTLGQVTSYTNEAGTTTAYTYDLMGRLASITHPGESWGSYYPTTIAFEQVSSAEYGIAPGHWRQVISTGNARTIRYFDALWNARLTARYDNANAANTSSFVEARYDFEGHKTFESYPERTFYYVDGPAGYPPVYGMRWQYDGLDRVVREEQDSEMGVLAATTTYLAGSFQKTVTNPRGHSTTLGFQAFDAPTEGSITSIAAPLGVNVQINRDRFGKPSAITRSGPYGGGTQSATRSYTYDIHHRLCKTVEPETGANVQGYDAAGNLAWKASGLGGGTPCDINSVPTSSRITYTYDAEDRITLTSFGDGSVGIGRSYTADGLLYQTWSDGSMWTYGYNNRRLLTSESLGFLGGTRSFVYGIDAHGNRASLTDPDGTISYSPNALGQPTQVSGYASGVAFHPNGLLARYTASNGIAYDLNLHTRGLPARASHAGVVHDFYNYDAQGNVTSITDSIPGGTSRSMAYDELDRLITANGAWGAGSYTYDALDNLRTSTLGSRSAVATIDAATNRLTQLTVNSQPIGFGYDANGNVRTRGAQAYAFDIGNRLQGATGIASYSYDGHGRRTWLNFNNVRSRLQMHSLQGKLMYSVDSARGTTRHVYLGDKVIAESNSVGGTTWLHTDLLGSPVARTNSAGQLVAGSRTRYEPYGAAVAGSLNADGLGFTGHVNDLDTGLVYMQQRYYEPLAGRFLSVDPVTTNANTGAMFNRYEYALNNPYAFVDPDGRSCTGSHLGEGRGCPQGGGLAFGRSGTSSSSRYSESPSSKHSVPAAPAGAANAPSGPSIESSWREIGAVADGVATASTVAAAGPVALAARAAAKNGMTVLYRAVSHAELKQIQKSGAFEAGPGSLGGKWFAETVDHARQWGNAMNGKGASAILEVQLSRSQASQLMRMERLDGIGPARYGELDQLRGAIIRVLGQ